MMVILSDCKVMSKSYRGDGARTAFWRFIYWHNTAYALIYRPRRVQWKVWMNTFLLPPLSFAETVLISQLWFNDYKLVWHILFPKLEGQNHQYWSLHGRTFAIRKVSIWISACRAPWLKVLKFPFPWITWRIVEEKQASVGHWIKSLFLLLLQLVKLFSERSLIRLYLNTV